jgi:hypothetical protein
VPVAWTRHGTATQRSGGHVDLLSIVAYNVPDSLGTMTAATASTRNRFKMVSKSSEMFQKTEYFVIETP